MFKKLVLVCVLVLSALSAYAQPQPEGSSCREILKVAEGEMTKQKMKFLGMKQLPSALMFGWSDGAQTVLLVFSIEPLRSASRFKSMGVCKRADGKDAFIYLGMAKNHEA